MSIPIPEPEPFAMIALLFPLGEKVVVLVVVAPTSVTSWRVGVQPVELC